MKRAARALRIAGYTLAALGGLAWAALFLIVMIHGSWPDWLGFAQRSFAAIHDLTGPFAFAAELMILCGPGFLAAAIGEWMDR